MGAPTLAGTWLRPAGLAGLLVVGPSLGTSAAELWQPVADLLADGVGVLAWDLPGHGSEVSGPFTIGDLAAGVAALVDHEAGEGSTFSYAGDSVGGAVGLQLLLDVPDRVPGAVLLSTGATIGDPDAWSDRAAAVREYGTGVVVDGSMQRWFSAATTSTRPELLRSMADTLVRIDPEGYAQVCEALAAFDVRTRLHEVTGRVLAIAGAEDVPTPPASLEAITDHVADGSLVVLDDVAHLPPVEAPEAVARHVSDHLSLR